MHGGKSEAYEVKPWASMKCVLQGIQDQEDF